MNRGFGSFILAAVLIVTSVASYAQVSPVNTVVSPDSVLISTQNATPPDSISPEEDEVSFDQQIDYDAKDSTIYDLINERVLLYGDATVKYGELTLKAPYIEFSFKDFTAKAKGSADSTGAFVNKVSFKQGDEEFEEDSLAYNFKTKKGVSYVARTQESGAYLIAGVSKKHENNWIHVRNGMLTTCDHENPHYYFKLTRAIAIPNEKVISGPMYMKIRKVPTPLALPFGFFPNKKESSQGILMPGYGNAQLKGFFLQNLGYYIPISQRLDTRVTFDIYSRGSWSVRNITNYKKLYKYNGSFNVSRTVNLNGFKELPTYSKTSTFSVIWTHNQDSKARPGQRFTANVKLGSSQNYKNNLNSSQQDYLSSTFTSAIQYGKSWAGSPVSLGVQASHTQNVQTRAISLTLPQVALTMSRVNVLKKLFPNAPIGINASGNFENSISAQENEFGWERMGTLAKKAQNGFQYSTQASTSWKLFNGALTINPSFNGNWLWTMKYLNPTVSGENGAAKLDTIYGFKQAFQYSTGASLNTRLYGTFNFRKGKRIKAMRHFVQPSAGFSYTPFSSYAQSGFYGTDGAQVNYTIWDAAKFRPASAGAQGNINLSVNQNLEAKVRDKSSAKVVYKKVKLLESFKMSTSYNMMRDSVRWSDIQLNAFTTLAKGLTVNYTSALSMYKRNSQGGLINQYMWQNGNSFLRQGTSAFSMKFTFTSKQKTGGTAPDISYNTITQNVDQANVNSNMLSSANFSVPWSIDATYILRMNKNFVAARGGDTTAVVQTFNLTGNVTMFKKLAISVNSGYDFETKKVSMTQVGLSYDLHCWQLVGSWIPNGSHKSYMLQLNIKASMFQDVKVQKRGNYGDKTLNY